ncbi:MAG: capsule biosynthesis protein [Rubricella sp.]
MSDEERDIAHRSDPGETDSSAEPTVEETSASDRGTSRAERRKLRQKRRAEAASTETDRGTSDETAEVPDETPEKPRKRRDVMTAARRLHEKRGGQTDDETPEARRDGAPPPDATPPPVARSERPPRAGAPAAAPKDDRPILYTEAQREAEIAQIQRELVLRRRRRWFLLWLRLAFFIALPTFLIGNFFYNHATPFYSTKSAFVIERGTAASALSGAGSLFSGTAFAAQRESISVQEFLVSREAMRIVDGDLDLLEHFSDPAIDDIQRLPPGATENEAYAMYGDRVLVGLDMAEGVLRLETIAADPEMALRMAERLIVLAEERVATMSDRNRADAVRAAEDAVQEARDQVDAAYERVLALQEQLGIFSAQTELALIQGNIASLTGQLEERRLTMAALMENERPNQAQLRVLEAEIARLEQAIAEQRALIVNAEAEQGSLARINTELERAQAELELQQMGLVAALEGREVARREASQQALYLAMVVNPILPEVPSYPRAFEYTVLSFIIFFAIYMIASLTVSILREQMSYGTVTS